MSRPSARTRATRCLLSAAPAAALASLLVASPAHSDEPSLAHPLTVRASSETSVYADTDHVTVVTPTIAASVEDPLVGWSAGGRYLVDVVTAASVDVVATATPAWTEARHVGSGSLGLRRGDFAGSLQGGASVEPDYVSIAGGASLSWDLFDQNLTLLGGYAFGHDTSGRAGTPFDVYSLTLEKHMAQLGASVLAGRASRLTLLGDVHIERGDASKPYRYVPMFAPGAASSVPAGASLDRVNEKRVPERPLDQLPLERNRYAVTGRFAHRFTGATLRLEERIYADSWGLIAQTSDAQYQVEVSPRVVVWPHARVHLQGGVDFWERAYELSPDETGRLVAPAYRTGDRELGPLRSLTAGAGLECDLSDVAKSRSWVLTLKADGVFTHYTDALYIERRGALFAAVSLDATFD